jgi:hypothetical protein
MTPPSLLSVYLPPLSGALVAIVVMSFSLYCADYVGRR